MRRHDIRDPSDVIAEGGVLAANLAADGFTGRETVLEGEGLAQAARKLGDIPLLAIHFEKAAIGNRPDLAPSLSKEA